MKPYIPNKGDYIAVNFDPQTGHEQKGRRPALVVSNTLFNEKTGLAMVCPIASKEHRYPFHVAIKNDPNIKGFVIVEQIKSIDYKARNTKFIGKASDETINMVLSILDACIF